MKITEAEILEAIRDAASRVPDRPANLIRAVELQQQLGFGHVQVRNIIRKWIAEGRAVPVKFPHKDMSGRVRRIEMYRITELPK